MDGRMDGRTAVTVFVDDAVRGVFPSVCARTGGPSDGTLTIRAGVGPVSSPSALMIVVLVLLGPPGWIALLVALLLYRPDHAEYLTVRLPWSSAADAEVAELRRRRTAAWACFGVGVVALLAALYFVSSAVTPLLVVLLGTVAAAAVLAMATSRRLARRAVTVELDGSRRWVTLYEVHPAFRAAVRAQQQPTDAQR